ncbi:50S ribosomal protein L12P, putative [Entamoeba invadens IP1]|uniref:50S ribosomal protein L12P, putative n=1 Tax=Entamoeba invadens IP1 TaxID=370355 RepID=A0A0A1UC61_ENTIV|nr:50S ribosomal protein L12P, putative [Entamoeba invadens IP1]ELP91293.1 50S ribosomal protein L12P, putative [Entamoeba invadens IP1]|eukprot:XP_004258064.1 50S ribosomal protein L12P, putative [Entamoeba invadens IP1]
MSAQQKQFAIAFAALLLHETKKEINVENLTAVLKVAGVQMDQWVAVMAKAFTPEKIQEFLDNFASSAPVAAAPVAAAETKKEETKEEQKEEKKDEPEEDFGGFGDLF